jgi:hypothetical protein
MNNKVSYCNDIKQTHTNNHKKSKKDTNLLGKYETAENKNDDAENYCLFFII